MNNFNPKQYFKILAVTILAILFLGYRMMEGDSATPNYFVESQSNYSEEVGESKESQVEGDIFVHISGRVKKPGLLILKSDSRLVDAVNAAGGLYNDADLDKINLAKKLSDEEKIYIPSISEDANEIAAYGFAHIEDESGGNLVNINTADIEELKSLPGVGDKTAEKIIDFRETQAFKEIEDIKEVSGIGDKKFEELKALITCE